VATGPASSVQRARLVTLAVDTGADGDNDPVRPIAEIRADPNAAEPTLTVPAAEGRKSAGRFSGLARERATARRKLYFSEEPSDPNDPDSEPDFFITVDGQTPAVFDPNSQPAITTRQGSVEDWTIENRSLENHEFHIHQIHFLLLEENGKPVSGGQYLDTINVPDWSGTGPYPSVTVRMDFRGPDVGDFVYHCHILEHEDNGMMAIIRVLPKE